MAGIQAGTIRGEYKKRPKKSIENMALPEFLFAIKKTTYHPRTKAELELWKKVIDAFLEHIYKEFKNVIPAQTKK